MLEVASDEERENAKLQVQNMKKPKALNFSQSIRRHVGGESGSVWTESLNIILCVWVFF